jgi:hypothetical protein
VVSFHWIMKYQVSQSEVEMAQVESVIGWYVWYAVPGRRIIEEWIELKNKESSFLITLFLQPVIFVAQLTSVQYIW